jgi:hypothetical protein
MKKSLADYGKEEKEEKVEIKVEKSSDPSFDDMRLVYLFEKAMDSHGSIGEDLTHTERTMKRLKCFKELLAALK